MSRRISNPKLEKLLKASGLALQDLASVAGCSRRNLLCYSRGRRLPILEGKLARECGLTIFELRNLLGLGTQQSRRGHAISAELYRKVVARLARYNKPIAIYRWIHGRGRWVNGGARYADCPDIQSAVKRAQKHVCAVIDRKRTGLFTVAKLERVNNRRK